MNKYDSETWREWLAYCLGAAAVVGFLFALKESHVFDVMVALMQGTAKFFGY